MSNVLPCVQQKWLNRSTAKPQTNSDARKVLEMLMAVVQHCLKLLWNKANIDGYRADVCNCLSRTELPMEALQCKECCDESHQGDIYVTNVYAQCRGIMLEAIFAVNCGVCQGGVLSPILFSVHVDDLIDELCNSGYGIYIGKTLCRLYFICR